MPGKGIRFTDACRLGRRDLKQRVHVNGKYNVSKASVLLTINYCDRYFKHQGLSLNDIELLSGEKHDYLAKRLPQFANTNREWQHAYLKRKWIIRHGLPVLVYKLTDYGKDWIREKAPADAIDQLLEILKPRWQEYLPIFMS